MARNLVINALSENDDMSIMFFLRDGQVYCGVSIKTDGPPPMNQDYTQFLVADVSSPLTANQRKNFLKACRDHALNLLGLA